jgi:pimeloyl-CoA synthetase
MQTIKTELIVNGMKVVVGHQFLEDIVRDIPDTKENKSVYSTLALSDNPEVRESISRKDNLSTKTIHLLLNDTNQEVVDNILSNSDLAKHIKEETLFNIIKSDNIKYLKTIASNIDSYVLCDTCKMATMLSKHKNRSVRFSLVQWNSSNAVTNKILQALSKDKDFDIANEAKKSLEWR